MTDVQLYFAIGIPTCTVLCSRMVGIFQRNHAVNQIHLRCTGLEGRVYAQEARIDARMSLMKEDVKTIVRWISDMDVRIARLEERTAR